MRKKKKPLLITLVIICGIVIGLFIVGRLTGAIAFYRTPSGANLPTIKVGEQFISSNLLSPERFDFITFSYTDSMQGRHARVYRICGMPGDNIAIKAGSLYVNGKLADDTLNLTLIYQIPEEKSQAVAEHFQLEIADQPISQGNGKALVFLSTQQTKELTELHIPFERHLDDSTSPSSGQSEIEATFHHPWTVDNFGPIQIPKDHYFVMGDNRYLAQDSRFIGFIKKRDLLGVVLGIR